MISLLMDNVNLGFEDMRAPRPGGEEGETDIIGYVLVITDPQSGIQVKLPLQLENARQIGNYLLGKPVVQIETQMPPAPPADSILKPTRR